MADSTIATEKFVMPSPESHERLLRYLDASRIANDPNFPGLVLMSLCFYVEDNVWEEALQDALRTVIEVEVEDGSKKRVGRA